MTQESIHAKTRRSTRQLLLVVAGMFAFGFALGPLYTAVCKLTGFNGKLSDMAVDTARPPLVDLTRTVKVLFITTVNGGKPWEFRAEQTSVEVHPGQLTTVMFLARNTEAHDIVAQAVPNIAPWEAARHMKKTECFCFNKQPFKVGEEKRMPVRFMLDPELPADVDTVTLSYTFFDVTETARQTQPKTPPA